MAIDLAIRPEALPQGALRLRRADVSAATVLVTAHGEVDAGNARALVHFVDEIAGDYTSLILDLGGLAFFGTEGLWALNRVKAGCVKRGKAVAVVAGVEASRLLRICDPHGALGVVPSVDDAAFLLS